MFGLIGTITHDVITFDSGRSLEGLGGVLYQAAVFCGLGKDVWLYTNIGDELVRDMEEIVKDWKTLRRGGVNRVPGPGNQVFLHYPEKGERVEILKSVVPPLETGPIIKDVSKFGMLILIINSGFDIKLPDWRKVISSASCPVWIDIHSLLLSRGLDVERRYVPLTEWKEWVEGVHFIQANAKEVATMLGSPDRIVSKTELFSFARIVFDLGATAVFITLGKEGVLVITPEEYRKLSALKAKKVVDTTGCGDVFCAATAVKLASGENPFSAASYGIELATEAVSVKGIEETHSLALKYR